VQDPLETFQIINVDKNKKLTKQQEQRVKEALRWYQRRWLAWSDWHCFAPEGAVEPQIGDFDVSDVSAVPPSSHPSSPSEEPSFAGEGNPSV